MKPDYQIVEDSPELVRDTYSKESQIEILLHTKGICRVPLLVNLEKKKLDETVEEINTIKQEMSEMKEMLRQLLEKSRWLKELQRQQIKMPETFRVNFNALVDDIGDVYVGSSKQLNTNANTVVGSTKFLLDSL